MGNTNIMPKGGFLRGALAGLTLSAIIFMGLSVAFPLVVSTGVAPSMAVEMNSAPMQPIFTSPESSSGISVNTSGPTSSPLIGSPSALEETAPEVVIAPETTAPVNAVSQLESMSNNDIQINSGTSAPLAVAEPVSSAIEEQDKAVTPTVEDTAQVPDVSIEINSGSGENDTTTEPKVLVQSITPEPAQAPLAEAVMVDNAFDAYSAAFVDDKNLPLMSFILLAKTVAEAEVVATFSTPVTLAVTSDNPAANDIIASYRAIGGEVVLLLPSEGVNALRKGGTPSNAPAQLAASLASVTGVLGVVDGPSGNVNQDTRMISTMLPELSKTGHAIMTVNGLGLNRTSILAQEAGVPATDISRVIDTDNGTIAVIRTLDKLVLQIGDQRAVVIYARATPDMLFSLKFWIESQKAQAVTIAPVSAAILRN